MKTAIVVNPNSGGGRTQARWAQIRTEVNSRLGGVEEFATNAPHDATRFAREVAEKKEYETLIAVGGDGTINEVINGLFDDQGQVINPELKIGIMSAGRGCDFIRSVGIPDSYREALGVFKNYKIQLCDVGLSVFKDEFGRECHRYFINIATAGLAGVVASKVSRSHKWIPPELVYFSAAAASFLSFKGQRMKVTVDGKIVHDGSCLNVFVANGAYSGAGMYWAPFSRVDDGHFDVVVVEALAKSRLFTSAHKIYDGTFIELPGVHTFKGQDVAVDSLDDVLLEMDGEQPGLAPVAFKIIPSALKLIVPAT